MDKKTSDLIRGIAILCAVQMTGTMMLGGYVVIHVEHWKSVGRQLGNDMEKAVLDMKLRLEKAKAGR